MKLATSSKTFVVNEPEKKKRGFCSYLPIVLSIAAIFAILALAGYYAFNIYGVPLKIRGCSRPILDPYGSSSWTYGAEQITFQCYEGHEMEGYVVEDGGSINSSCVAGKWQPPPPTCITLPIRLECTVKQNGLQGIISMWQKSKSEPTFIYGTLNPTAEAINAGATITEVIDLSQISCEQLDSEVGPNSLPEPLAKNSGQLEIRFQNSNIVAYKPVQLGVTVVFVDKLTNLTKSVVSVHQGKLSMVIPTDTAEKTTVTENKDSKVNSPPCDTDSISLFSSNPYKSEEIPKSSGNVKDSKNENAQNDSDNSGNSTLPENSSKDPVSDKPLPEVVNQIESPANATVAEPNTSTEADKTVEGNSQPYTQQKAKQPSYLENLLHYFFQPFW